MIRHRLSHLTFLSSNLVLLHMIYFLQYYITSVVDPFLLPLSSFSSCPCKEFHITFPSLIRKANITSIIWVHNLFINWYRHAFIFCMSHWDPTSTTPASRLVFTPKLSRVTYIQNILMMILLELEKSHGCDILHHYIVAFFPSRPAMGLSGDLFLAY